MSNNRPHFLETEILYEEFLGRANALYQAARRNPLASIRSNQVKATIWVMAEEIIKVRHSKKE